MQSGEDLEKFGGGLFRRWARVQNQEEYHQAQLLSALLAGMVILSGLLEIYILASDYYPGYGGHWITLLGIALFTMAFLLNRRGYLAVAAWITVITLSLSICVLTYVTYGLPVDITFLYYLYLPALFASFFIPQKYFFPLIGLFIAAIFFPSVLIFHFPAVVVAIGPVFFIAICAVLTYLVHRHLNILENDRRIELAGKEERYRSLLETSYEGICILQDDVILDANLNFARLFGFEPHELIGELAYKLMPPSISAIARQSIELIQDHPVDLPVYHRDGSVFYVELVSRFQNYSGQRVRVVAVRDVTQRVEAKKALDNSEHLYRTLFEGANDAILLLGLNDLYIAANQKAVDMLGCSISDLIGRSIFDVIADEEHADSRRVKQELLAGNSLPLYERILRKSDGSKFTVEINATLVRDTEGNPIYIQSIVRDVTERRRIEMRIRQQLERMKALQEIDMMISSSTDLKVTLDIFLNSISSLLMLDGADIILVNANTFTPGYTFSRGFNFSTTHPGSIQIDDRLSGRAILERQLVQIEDLRDHAGENQRLSTLASLGFRTCFALPLIAKGVVKGVLEVFRCDRYEPAMDWLDFLEMLAGQAAIAVDNADLFQNLQRTNVDLLRSYDATLEGWSKAMELRDKLSTGHTRQMADMAIQIGRDLGLSDDDLVNLRRGALLHDIGKLAIPDSILLKPGPLTEEEWQVVHQHPIYAQEMLASIPFLRQALDIPYFHHERWDGSGYPQGLKGENIPFAARIFSVVDVWDALTSNRPYRGRWSHAKAKTYLREQAGVLFDPRVVEAFLHIVSSEQNPV